MEPSIKFDLDFFLQIVIDMAEDVMKTDPEVLEEHCKENTATLLKSPSVQGGIEDALKMVNTVYHPNDFFPEIRHI